jgi:DNA-binding CsgD family transcriptional regulator
MEASTDAYQSLSGREGAVLQLMGESYSNLEVADQLGLSIKKLQSHRAAVMQKLVLRDVTHLVCYAVRRDLVDLER